MSQSAAQFTTGNDYRAGFGAIPNEPNSAAHHTTGKEFQK